MREFFRGWKRKLGVVTLLVACAFTTGWIRSTSTRDIVELWVGTHEQLLSMNGSITWFQSYQGDGALLPNWRASPAGDFAKMFDGLDLRWRWRSIGFAEGTFTAPFPGSGKTKLLVIPYWSIVIPLILLSAWLLLSKPRARVTSNAAERCFSGDNAVSVARSSVPA